MWVKALFHFQKFSLSRVIAMYVGKMKILDYFMIAHDCAILDYFMIANGKECDYGLFSYFKSFRFRG